MVGQLDPVYSSMEKRGAAYVPSVAEYGKKRRTTQNILYIAGCICGLGLAVWMVYITLMVNKDAATGDQQSQALGGRHGLNYSGLGVNIGTELEAMKKILVHMAQEQATSILEANPDEMQRRTAELEAQPSNLHSLLEDLEFKPKDSAWITRDSSGYRHYVALFAEDGRPLIESREETRGKHIRRAQQTSGNNLDVEKLSSQKQNKEFVFSLRYTNGNCLEITTSSGLKAVASGESSVVLEPDVTPTATTTTPTTSLKSITPPITASMTTGTLGSSCWLLSKYENKFFRIESATHGKYWSTKGHDGSLGLSEDWERFTGIHTNFILDFSLGRSNDYQLVQPIRSDPIPIWRYGDIKIRYLNRQGGVMTGYVCDSEWGYDDASSVCNDLWAGSTGIPTYRGRFSLSSDIIDFAISGLSCRNQEPFQDCGIKTECSDWKCQAQKSMRLFDGKGYGCSNGDAAGVVCGTTEQIFELKKRKLEASCNSSEHASSSMSIIQMASFEEQAKEVSATMSKNKHWSDFLLPIPMTVSMMSILMLISAQYEGKVELTRPVNGEWEELKWDLLTPNLYELNGMVTSAFDRSTTAMKKINVNSEDMNVQLLKSIKWGASKSTLAKRRLERSLRKIAKSAKENLDEANETINRFDHANRFIEELVSAMANSQNLKEDEKIELNKDLEAMRNQRIRDQENLEDNQKSYEEYKEKVNKTRHELFVAAKAVESSSCLMDEGCSKEGTRSCEECAWRPPRRAKHMNGDDICIGRDEQCMKHEKLCVEQEKTCIGWRDGGCEAYGDRCKTTKVVDKDCNIAARNCNSEAICTERERYCVQKKPDICIKWDNFCVKKELVCTKYEHLCTQFKILPAGSFCKTNNTGDPMTDWGDCCSGCAGRDEMKEVLSNVLRTSLMLDIKSLDDIPNIEIIQNIVEVTLGITSKINEKVKNTTERVEDENTQGQSVEVDGETLETEIRLFVLSLPLQTRQLEQIAKKNPLASEAKSLLGEFEKVITPINIKTPANQLTSIQKASIDAVNGKITSFATTVNKEAKQLEITLNLASFQAPAEVVDKAEAYMNNKIKRTETAKKIESLSQNILSSLKQITTKEFDIDDFKETIQFLKECTKHLKKLTVAWGSIKDFFSGVSVILKKVEEHKVTMEEDFEDILLYISDSSSDTLGEEVEKSTVTATALNIYIKKVSSFYVTIMETGVLERMRGLTFDRLTPDEFTNTKLYIRNEALAMLESISQAVSVEQAELNDELNQKMWNVKNVMSCLLKDVEDLKGISLLEEFNEKEEEVRKSGEYP